MEEASHATQCWSWFDCSVVLVSMENQDVLLDQFVVYLCCFNVNRKSNTLPCFGRKQEDLRRTEICIFQLKTSPRCVSLMWAALLVAGQVHPSSSSWSSILGESSLTCVAPHERALASCHEQFSRSGTGARTADCPRRRRRRRSPRTEQPPTANGVKCLWHHQTLWALFFEVVLQETSNST